MMRHIALLGSTGSIGRNSLAVIRTHPDLFKLETIAAGNNLELLREQINEFSPGIVCVKDAADVDKLKSSFPELAIVYGNEGLIECVTHDTVDTMISAINGTVALAATIAAIKNNLRICLANKETLVAAGDLINRSLDQSKSEIIPIDSEQSAIFQCICQRDVSNVRKVILTASGGPFFRSDIEEFKRVTPEKALHHPTWVMGEKVTIDSATLMNKALEIIEAYYLFDLSLDQIDVLIHPQSIVHSLVEFVDASILGQISQPDMKIPIRYSLSYPDRLKMNAASLNLASMAKLEFYPVDRIKFPSIDMAYEVLRLGGNAGAILNAANEVAVENFLQKKISFLDIFSVVERTLTQEAVCSIHSLEDLEETIQSAKRRTAEMINGETRC